MSSKKGTLIWSEEFSHQNINQKIWSFEEGYIRNNEKQYYTKNRSENCRIENGNLIIEARKEQQNDFNYTSASLTTKHKKSFLYGKIEVKAKLPFGRGVWPAIWLLGEDVDDVGWPLCGEIDIMEHVGYDPNIIHANVHTQAYNHVLETNKGNCIMNHTLDKEFHVYSIDWSVDKIDFFFDGKKYFTFQNDYRGNIESWPFNKPHYLIINLAIGGFWGGKKGVDNTIFPQIFSVNSINYFSTT